MNRRRTGIIGRLRAKLAKFGFVRWVPLLFSIGAAFVYLTAPGPLHILRNNVFDQYQRWQPRSYSPASLVIIDVDDASLQKLGQWPWPRTLLAELLEKLGHAQPAAIAFDMVFAETDRTSPQALLEVWSLSDSLRQLFSSLPDHDQIFADVLQQNPVVLGYSLLQTASPALKPMNKARYVFSGASPQHFVHSFAGALPVLPTLEQSAAGLGVINFIADADGVVRRVPLVMGLADQLLPSLTAETLRLVQGAENYLIDSVAGGLTEIRIGQLRVTPTADGEAWVYYSPPTAERYVSAWQVLLGLVPEQRLTGKTLLIGSSAQGLMDQHLSPLGDMIPGVEVHGQFLEQILAGNQLSRPYWAQGVELLVILIGGILIGTIALRYSIGISLSCMLLTLALMSIAGWVCFSRYALLLDPLAPSLVLFLIFIASSSLRQLATERRQNWIKQAFSRYLSPNLVDYLLEHPEELELRGQRRHCSFVFTDLAGFTSFMEKIDPEEAVDLLNGYLDRIIAIAFEHNGTLDRIVGDAVAIMFSAPVAQVDHQQRALNCALDIHQFASSYAVQLNGNGIAFGQTHIGVHSGEVIVGNVGGSRMFDYRALGDAVNTASRLQGANKYLGTLVCVSEAVLSGCNEFAVRPIGPVLLKGKSAVVMIYEPLGFAAIEDVAYNQAYALLTSDSHQALAAFERLAAQRPQDALVKLQLKRLLAGEQGVPLVLSDK